MTRAMTARVGQLRLSQAWKTDGPVRGYGRAYLGATQDLRNLKIWFENLEGEKKSILLLALLGSPKENHHENSTCSTHRPGYRPRLRTC